MYSFLEEKGETTILHVKVSPGSKINSISKISDCGNFLRLKIAAAPEKGKANKELVCFLAKKFGLSKSDIEILRGETSREKILLCNISSKELLNKTQQALGMLFI